MLVALMCQDKPDHLEVRKANREAHLAHIKDSGIVVMAGPLLDDDGQMCGSLIVMDVPDMATAQAWVDGDPYGKAGLFASSKLIQWNKVIG